MEDVVRKNLLAIRQDNTETRKLCHETVDEVANLKKMIAMQNVEIHELKKAIDVMRKQLYSGQTS